MKTSVRWAVAVSLLAAFVVTWHGLSQVPRYEATAKVLVEQRQANDGKIHLIPLAIPPERLEKTSQAMATTIDGPGVVQRVVERLNLPKGSTGEVRKNMSAEYKPDAMFIDITYTDTSPKKAQLIVNAAGQVAHDYAKGGDFTATQWGPAKLPVTPVSPDPLRNDLIALAIGLVLSTVVIAVREYLRGNYQRFL
jgi:capsular polysaccharide biosynthesis protein